jgi:hypothetical protein
VNRAPPAVSPDDGGSETAPEGHARTRLPRAPAGRIGFSDAKQGARSASPMSFGSRGLSRRSRRDSGRVNNSDRDAPHLCPRPHRRAPSRARGRSGGRFEIHPNQGASSSRDTAVLQAYNPLFKERAPELHMVYRAPGFCRGSASVAFMALHSLRITRVCAGRRRVVPTPRANRLSSDAPIGTASCRAA